MEDCKDPSHIHQVIIPNPDDDANPIHLYPYPTCTFTKKVPGSPGQIQYISPSRVPLRSESPSPVKEDNSHSIISQLSDFEQAEETHSSHPFLDVNSPTPATIDEPQREMRMKLLPAKPLGSMVTAAPIGGLLETLSDIKDLVVVTKERITLAMETGSFKYFLKTATMNKKYPYLYDMERLCLAIEAVDSKQWKGLYFTKERDIVISTKLEETIVELTNLCYTVKNIARDHHYRARKVKKHMLGLLARLVVGTEKLVLGARQFTGDMTALDGTVYGKDIHLVSLIKGCLNEWKELED